MDPLFIFIASVASLSILGLLLGILLSTAAKIFAVEVDPRIEKVRRILPGANCGACGFAGCTAYAEALIKGANPALCTPGGADTAKNIAELLGIKEFEVTPKKAVILCGAGKELCGARSEYLGEKTCKAEMNVSGGSNQCVYSCLAHGDCIAVCPVDAISPRGKLPPLIDRAKCVGCGKCVEACPRKIIILEDEAHRTFVLCRSRDKGFFVKKICKVGCIACRICVKDVPGGTMTMEGRLPRVEYEKGEPTEEWIAKCPQKTIVKFR